MKQLIWRGIAQVVLFWWVATGLIIALQRCGPTPVIAVFVATALAV